MDVIEEYRDECRAVAEKKTSSGQVSRSDILVFLNLDGDNEMKWNGV